MGVLVGPTMLCEFPENRVGDLSLTIRTPVGHTGSRLDELREWRFWAKGSQGDKKSTGPSLDELREQSFGAKGQGVLQMWRPCTNGTRVSCLGTGWMMSTYVDGWFEGSHP